VILPKMDKVILEKNADQVLPYLPLGRREPAR
jgi:hypothetical protein